MTLVYQRNTVSLFYSKKKEQEAVQAEKMKELAVWQANSRVLQQNKTSDPNPKPSPNPN